MALTDEVQSRYSSQILINVSNPQNSTSTTLDSTRLSLASTDVQAIFTKHGLTYDNSVATHVQTGVGGVFARLSVMTGQIGADGLWEAFLKDMKLLVETKSRARKMPKTDYLLSPTEDTAGTRPTSDRKNFYGYVSKPPGGSPYSGAPTDSNP